MIDLFQVAMEGFSFTKFFESATTSLRGIAGFFIILLGLVMIIVAGWQIAKGLIAHGKANTNWFIAILLLIVGGIFFAGGIGFLITLAKNLGEATKGLGEGEVINQILPFFMR